MNCKTLLRRTQEAIEELKIEANIEKVEAYPDIAAYGILKTPGLVFNEKVVLAGTVPTVEKIKELLLSFQSAQ
jgi:hypothetical protein